MTTAEHHRAHPQPGTYWLIALFLAVVTALEVAIAYIDLFEPVLVPALFTLGAVKFGTVVAFFMHLRFDRRLYRGFFLVGVVAAPILFIVVLATFEAL
jgi:cytochrome c oxidase subunit 4